MNLIPGKHYVGRRAVAAVKSQWPDEWHPLMEPVVLEEGYVHGDYKDTKGIQTCGVGQTGRYRHIPFPQVFEVKLQQIRALVEGFDELPKKTREALILSHYRGSWLQSPKTRLLFSKGLYTEAAKEFLDSDEYREAVLHGPLGIKKRFERVARGLAQAGRLADEGSSQEDVAP